MDRDRFDLLARSLATPSRRGFSRALAGLGFMGGLGRAGVEARKKRRKKKPCKGKRRCGKRCIPKSACCTDGDRGSEQRCEKGACVCPDSVTRCGDACLDEGQCCTDADCVGDQICAGNVCTCPNPSDLACAGGACCDRGQDEVCDFQGTACRVGCPASDVCNGEQTLSCAVNCVCIATVGPTPLTTCVNLRTLLDDEECRPCAQSADCGAGEVCVPGNASGSGICRCDSAFCVPRC